MEGTDWKAKSIKKTKENKELKKRLIEVKSSRDSWKEKSMANKARCTALENSLKKRKIQSRRLFFKISKSGKGLWLQLSIGNHFVGFDLGKQVGRKL